MFVNAVGMHEKLKQIILYYNIVKIMPIYIGSFLFVLGLFQKIPPSGEGANP